MKIPKTLTSYVALSSFLLTSACSSSVEVVNWRELPKDQKIRIVTKSRMELDFTNWTFGVDSSFVGLTESTAQFISSDSIQVAYVMKGLSPFVSLAITIGVGTIVLLLLLAILFPEGSLHIPLRNPFAPG